jgi:DNA-binding Lrp family transcriptional regulator
MITCDMGSEESVIAKLKTINSVKEVNQVWGSYDVLVKLEGDNSNDLKNIITSKIRKIPSISTSITLTVIESQE